MSHVGELGIDPGSYPGGIALWGALPAVFDTTSLDVERGVHVHARKIPNGEKEIDFSFPTVRIEGRGAPVQITGEAAVAYVAGSILGLTLKYLECPSCGVPHLDLDNYALDPHRKHLCLSCNNLFEDHEHAIANPIIHAKELLGDKQITRKMKKVDERVLKISQSDPRWSGGIQIWGTHPAILWTAEREEEDGIHVHIFEQGVSSPLVDQTYGLVTIDGFTMDPQAVRSFMVQQHAPIVRDRLASLDCSTCGVPILEGIAPKGIVPSTEHVCANGHTTASAEPLIANPMVRIVDALYKNARFAGLSQNPNR